MTATPADRSADVTADEPDGVWAQYPYSGRVVLVTGGGSGIGRAIARAFLSQGAAVAVAGRRRESLVQTVEGYQNASVHAADMSTTEGVDRVLDEVAAAHGRIDIVVANAGLSLPGTIEDLDPDSWVRMRSINLDGLILLARAAVPWLRASRGVLLATSSIAGLGGDWNQTGYNATKAAVNALVECMALDLGCDGIRVNAIAPGFIATAQTQDRLDDPDFWGALDDRLGIPRAGRPEDIARAALFLCSPDASYITGVVLPVDGGITAACGTPRPR